MGYAMDRLTVLVAEDNDHVTGPIKLTLRPLGGLELLDLVRQSPDTPNPQLPVIVVTGHTAFKQFTAARDHGATEI